MKPGSKTYAFTATSVTNARDKVKRKFRLANFSSESLRRFGILNVYLDGKHVHPIDKVTRKLKVVDGEQPENHRAGLKRKRVKNGKHRDGLRKIQSDVVT